MITLHKVEQGSEEWKLMREELYTGSGADKLLRFSGSLKVENGVTTKYALAGITGFEGNFWTKRGHMLEDQAIELYEQIMSVKVARYGMITNSKWPGCGYSPDGVPPVPLLEVKSFDIPHHLELINAKRTEDLPLKVLAQVYFGQFIGERPETHLIPYNPHFAKKEIDGVPNPDYDPSKAFKIITIKRNPRVMANFRRILSGLRMEVTA